MSRRPEGETSTSSLSLAGSSEGEAFTTTSEAEAAQRAASIKSKGKQRAVEGSSDEVMPTPVIGQGKERSNAAWLPAKSWVHFVAGGAGGMCGAVVTAPFDVVKTRLQSDLFAPTATSKTSPHRTGLLHSTRRLLYNFVETGNILRDTRRNEGFSALFRGLGPTLVGVIPARSINFFTYGNGKQIYAQLLNDGKESPAIHLISAATAGVVTSAVTNPIWVVKTRLQLQDTSGRSKKASTPTPAKLASAPRSASPSSAAYSSYTRLAQQTNHPSMPTFTPSFGRTQATLSAPSERLLGSMQCIAHIWRYEGIKGFYRGLSASLLGVAEGTIQWTLYERFKAIRRKGIPASAQVQEEGWLDKIGAAGSAKLIATLITYPHEVARTRLRQAPPPGASQPRYTGLFQTFQLVFREEGMAAMYSGLSPHLLRVVPNAAVMYFVYELVLKYA